MTTPGRRRLHRLTAGTLAALLTFAQFWGSPHLCTPPWVTLASCSDPECSRRSPAGNGRKRGAEGQLGAVGRALGDQPGGVWSPGWREWSLPGERSRKTGEVSCTPSRQEPHHPRPEGLQGLPLASLPRNQRAQEPERSDSKNQHPQDVTEGGEGGEGAEGKAGHQHPSSVHPGQRG